MDYEGVKVVILAVLKKWQETQKVTMDRTEHPNIPIDFATAQIAGRFAQEVLVALETSFDIIGGQRP